MTSERLLTPAQPGEPVLAYCRVSTEMQGDDGYSLDDQERRLREYAERTDLLLDSDDIFSETFSGARVDRPAMDRLLLRPGEALSAKARKAADLRAKGQPIELMPEEDFFQLLTL